MAPLAYAQMQVIAQAVEATGGFDDARPTGEADAERAGGEFPRTAAGRECLNVSWFQNLFDAKRKIAAWRKEYNEERPHSGLGYLTPNEYAARSARASCRNDGDEAALENASAFASGVSQAGPDSITYDYDTQGRVTRARRRIFSHEHASEIVYNERGDKAAEITRNAQIRSEEEQSGPRPELPSYSEVRYAYQYDDRRNWTEQITSYRSSPDGNFRIISRSPPTPSQLLLSVCARLSLELDQTVQQLTGVTS